MSKPHVLIAEPHNFDPTALGLLRDHAEVYLEAVSPEQLPEAFARYDAIWLKLRHRIDSAALGPQPRCRVLAANVTGLEHIDEAACAAHRMRIVSLRGEKVFLRRIRATAEHTLALTLALLRHIPAASAAVAGGTWSREPFLGREIFEKTVGIVGMGRLGQIVAGYFTALGATVLGYDPYANDWPDEAQRLDTLPDLFRCSDIVSVHVSASPETVHLIDASILQHAKPGAVLINTARGSIVEQGALLEALTTGRLSGAALDVLEGEPHITPHHAVVQALRSLPNLLVVPHIGGHTQESAQRTEQFIAKKLVEALAE